MQHELAAPGTSARGQHGCLYGGAKCVYLAELAALDTPDNRKATMKSTIENRWVSRVAHIKLLSKRCKLFQRGLPSGQKCTLVGARVF
jgi:hypothetical protein